MYKYLLLAVLFFCFHNVHADEYELLSPNGQLKIKLQIKEGTQYEIWHGETQLISPSTIGLNLDNGTIVGGGTVKNIERNSINDVIEVPIGKNKTLQENYNELIIYYNENYDLVVRAYNEGIAYRFITALDEDIIVKAEDMIFNFPIEPTVYFPEAVNLEHWEKTYQILPLNSIESGKYAITPILYSFPDTPYKLAIAESDLYDYPGLYIETNGHNSMKGMWAHYPETVHEPENVYSNHVPLTRYDYIATTTGSRTFPWRVFIVSDSDKSLLNNELVYMLAEPQQLEDISWVTPGKSAWEWWHKAMLEGVDFPVGNDNLGFELYRYYIDFAAANNIEYLTLDAGWNGSYIRRLCQYAKTRNVKIIVWTWASNLVDPGQENVLSEWKNSGVSGVKIDFFQRNDQIAMTWGHKLAKELARLEMIGNFHGCPVPTGLNRTYPNILNFEAIIGNEENFWRRGCDPDYHVQFPFIRSLAGPEDFTPGSMRNKTKLQFTPVDKPNTIPSSQGTRAHELAMYVVFDQWLGYLCDAPTEYEKFPDILDFFSTVPTVWDQTLPLDAKLGEYIVMAKQTKNDWYVGGMSNWDAHDVEVDFSFLPTGKSFKSLILRDTRSSGNYPTRYESEEMTITSETKMDISMAKGGGFVIRLIESGGTSINDIKSKPSVFVDREAGIIKLKAEENIKSCEIFDATGKPLLSDNFEGTNDCQMNISSLSPGIYIGKIQTNSTIDSFKFIY